MDILNKSINSFNFQDIVDFCQQGIKEDVQIDYKKDLTSGSLSKHFAAFSNTRGGVIIIGVEEDKTTGLPKNWDGIAVNAQNIETIHQWANNVDPLPKYQIHATDEVKGKQFVLIRIYEGDDTPYYVQNDGRVWIRTGNISKELIEIASADYAKLLYTKQKEAEETRDYYLSRAEEVLRAWIDQAEIERIKKTNPEVLDPASTIFKTKRIIGEVDCILTVAIQPHYPTNALTSPKQLKDQVSEYECADSHFTHFPSRDLNPIPEGVTSFYSNDRDGTFHCQQVYAQGLLFEKLALNESDQQNKDLLYLTYLAGKILVVLKSAQRFYKLFGYQGNLKGEIKLERVKGLTLIPINNDFRFHNRISLLPNYSWIVKLDTNVLLNDDDFLSYYIDLLKTIYWDLGFEDMNEQAIKDFLIKTRLITPPSS